MNTSQLKIYAPKARKDFIEAIKARAAKFGITESDPAEMMVRDDVAMIYGEAYPKQVYQQRQGVLELVKAKGFEPAMEAMAYTWFNRLMALRYMELHGFLDHGYRVLSHPEGASSPEILQHARHVELPDLDQAQVTELLLAGNKDEELYRHLLLAQCHALHQAMPFLFEPINDATELLLPDNLLHSDSLIRKMVNEVPEEDWETVEVIGWLYQFYISEKKDQVIGKVVASEDIPAATQLFTPNWIVKYMVQNSLGAQWMATYPHSPLKEQMEYYIEPAVQTDEVKAQLAAITPSTLNPEKLTLIDPASGSGHILVEAYELFKAIYLERGYRQTDVAQLILEKNLYGLDIDERAAQLTGFALMMKGRADDRRLFERGVKLNVMALQDSASFDAERLAQGVKLADFRLQLRDLTNLKRLFEHATTFGSLIQVPAELAGKLPTLKQLSEATSQDLFVSNALKRLRPLMQQAEMLAAQYDAVVVNPPYMGGKFQTPNLKKYLKDYYKGYQQDFFSAFINRSLAGSKRSGRVGIVAPYVWMFISSYEHLREKLIDEASLTSLIQLEYNAFEPACIPIATFTLMRDHVAGITGSFIKLSEFTGHQNQAPRTLEAINNPNCGWLYTERPSEFKKIPGSPVAYWVSHRLREAFEAGIELKCFAEVKHGMTSGKNEAVVRTWPEIDKQALGLGYSSREEALSSRRKWFPYNKGGPFRKWYGNCDFVIRYDHYGNELMKSFSGHRHDGKSHYFREGVTWTLLSSSFFAARYTRPGFVFDVNGSSLFCEEPKRMAAFLCSVLSFEFLKVLNPTLAFQAGNLKALPVSMEALNSEKGRVGTIADVACAITQSDWDTYERSWDFQSLPILTASPESSPTLETSYTAWTSQSRNTISEMKCLEEENNRIFIDAYGLQDELTPDVPIEQITLTVNPAYRYGGKLTEEQQWTRFRQDTMKELVSYAIGCMMGRYSLDEPGLIYAHSGNEGFDPRRYTTFPADDDGIIPLTNTEWFNDDAANRIIEFISVAWPSDTAGKHLEENLTFLAENLKPKANETSRETIRRYLCDRFFKDHLRTYKKRPIYWLFSSGKHKALQCLVYLHRYNRSTLARMRMDYVVPLLGRLNARIESLSHDIEAATTTAQANKLRRESEKRKKQLEELRTYDEKLRHTADQRITLDLDDGVKVNYGKFGDLLAEVKTVTGKKP